MSSLVRLLAQELAELGPMSDIICALEGAQILRAEDIEGQHGLVIACSKLSYAVQAA